MFNRWVAAAGARLQQLFSFEARCLPMSGLMRVQRLALKPLLILAIASKACCISELGLGPLPAALPSTAAAKLVSTCII